MEKKFSTKVLAEIAIFAAIAFALDALQAGIWRGVWLSGGSIGFAMVPIFIIAYRRGFLPGFLCGFIVSIIQMLGGVYAINGSSFDNPFMKAMGPFFQIMLDYVLAYTCVGLSGAFAGLFHKKTDKKYQALWIIVGTVVGGLLKYFCHVLAGGWFWLNQGGSFWGVNDSSWLYSFVYNGAFMIPNIIICTAVTVAINVINPMFLNPTLGVQVNELEDDSKVIRSNSVLEEKVNEK